MASRHRAAKTATWQKATALLPLALLAGAWTASLSSATVASADSPQTDPGVPSVPTTTFNERASYTVPPALDPKALTSDPARHPATGGVAGQASNGIPTAALTAYKRAQLVLDQADPACHLSWELVAAIGRVESDHGRYGGSVLGSDGKSRPGIYGLPLDGTQGTALIRDTDSGHYDDDPVFDRAVGPMQFIPGTWEIVGVDGDGDGVRDPQDIDDAAVATGVYLCAGERDLSTTTGQRSAVFSYNHSNAYVDLVLDIMTAYAGGDYTQVADGLPSNNYVPAPDLEAIDRTPRAHRGGSPDIAQTAPSPGPGAVTPDGNTPQPPTDGGRPAEPRGHDGSPQPQEPDNPDPSPTPQPSPDPTPTPTPSPDPTDTVKDTVKDTKHDTVDPVVEATNYCKAELTGAGVTAAQLDSCVRAYVAGGKSAADAVVDKILGLL